MNNSKEHSLFDILLSVLIFILIFSTLNTGCSLITGVYKVRDFHQSQFDRFGVPPNTIIKKEFISGLEFQRTWMTLNYSSHLSRNEILEYYNYKLKLNGWVKLNSNEKYHWDSGSNHLILAFLGDKNINNTLQFYITMGWGNTSPYAKHN